MNLLGECSELISFWATLAQLWPSSGKRICRKCAKMVVSDHYLKTCYTIQFKLVVYTYWLSARKWFAFERRWPNFGHLVPKKQMKMVQNGDFRPLSEKVFTQSNSNLMCTLIGWVFKINSLLGRVGQILVLQCPQNDCKWRFSVIIWKRFHTIQFKLRMCTYLVSFQNWFAFGTGLLNFGPLVATK